MTEDTRVTNTIKQIVAIAAPPDRVYRALTDASELVKWFPTTAKSDARPGGSYAFSYEFSEATDRNHGTEGHYLDVVPNQRVRYTWPAGHTQVPTEVGFVLAPEGSRTKLTLTHSGWTPGTEESQKEHDLGWGFFLQNLKSWLEQGQDARASAMGMKTVVAA